MPGYREEQLGVVPTSLEEENADDVATANSTSTLIQAAPSPNGSGAVENSQHVFGERQQEFARLQGDAPACDNCGSITVRNGNCYLCYNCGSSMGCS